MPVPRPTLRRVAIVALLAVVATSLGCGSLRVFFPAHDYDEEPPVLPDSLTRPAVLVFSKTNGFRHEEAIPAGIAAIERIAADRGWSVFATENGAVHNPEQLARFDAVVWHNVSADVLDEAQRQAFRSWIEGGGGVVSIHGSGGDTSYEWSWYVDTLIGAQFIGHPMGPQFQEATIVVEDPAHPAMQHLPAAWVRTDEWYSFEASPRSKGVRVLATLDESTYSPRMKMLWFDRDLRMGDDHPIIWSHCIGKGRALYTALGHPGSAYEEPLYAKFLEEAIAWAMPGSEACDPSTAKP